MRKEPTTTDILEAISDFSTSVDQRFEKIDQKFKQMDKRFDKLESNVRTIKSTMVTKDYLDEKLSDLRGDLTVLIRKEDT